MDLKIFFSTLILIFLAELGDKTQLAVVALSAKEKTPLTIFVSALFGFALATAIAVVVGIIGAKFIPLQIIQKIAAVAFIIIGILILFNKL
jgi:putative Ca2+/H+ antiporter (TMEM165/GDT1 family)